MDRRLVENIGIDIDEVLANFVECFLLYYNARFNSDYNFCDIVDYNLWNVLGGTRENMISLVYDFHETQFFRDIQPIEGSMEGVRLLNAEHRLYAVTSRQTKIKQPTIEWLEKYFSGCFSGVEFTNNYTIDGIALRKADACKKLSIGALVEDMIEHADDCAKEGINVLLFDKPWNKDYAGVKNITRVHDWKEIIKIF